MQKSADRTPHRAVIVDKYRAAATALQAVLDGAGGFVVVGVFNEPSDANVESIVALDPSLVLIDVTTDGASFLRRLRKRLPSARIVAMTTRPTADGEALMLKAGADGYLEKSLDRGKMVRRLTMLSCQSQAAGSC